MAAARKNATPKRGRPFAPGNPGRPKGSRNKVSRNVEMLLEGEAEKLTRKAVRLALRGDTTALKLCLDRIAPVRKGRRVEITLPAITTTSDIVAGLAAITAAAARGDITTDEAQAMAGVLELKRKAIEQNDIEQRLARLEQKATEP
jgi:hypothetical protein